MREDALHAVWQHERVLLPIIFFLDEIIANNMAHA